jgi:hypothetical protein
VARGTKLDLGLQLVGFRIDGGALGRREKMEQRADMREARENERGRC